MTRTNQGRTIYSKLSLFFFRYFFFIHFIFVLFFLASSTRSVISNGLQNIQVFLTYFFGDKDLLSRSYIFIFCVCNITKKTRENYLLSRIKSSQKAYVCIFFLFLIVLFCFTKIPEDFARLFRSCV